MIVGLVFGVLAFIAICLALLLAYTRYRRRKRTTGFQRHLMVRQFGSSPLVFERMTPSFSTSEDGEGYREYDNADILEPGLVTQSEISHPPSIYSEPSVQSIHSDSPSIFYTAVPRAGAPGEPALPPSIFSNLSSALGLTLGPPVSESFAPAPAPPPLPQLAPGWVFPRAPVRTSQLPPPKTSRQMEIYDRKVRLQGKLITMQGWGNTTASDSQKAEMMVLKEQIRRLEVLENSPWAMGTSDQLPDLT
ncbi:hypothetical protein BDP27DRAFT_43344 [Rhodocollybia butyracea]|uniref:Uncharacterized protein n=1 Tax=Rhodocollybia butyracea TaxID=206335 RepID=A0A9P5Q6G1_9AGAR|nr:hypothetical protein BDP27DRAFT_43344 [Rhodocollybia butyracea]